MLCVVAGIVIGIRERRSIVLVGIVYGFLNRVYGGRFRSLYLLGRELESWGKIHSCSC